MHGCKVIFVHCILSTACEVARQMVAVLGWMGQLAECGPLESIIKHSL